MVNVSAVRVCRVSGEHSWLAEGLAGALDAAVSASLAHPARARAATAAAGRNSERRIRIPIDSRWVYRAASDLER
jgi:hypothetical protein